VYGKSKAQCQQKLRAVLTAADNGVKPIASRGTVAQWLEEWLATSVRLRLRPRTVDSYQTTVARYIDPAIGRIPLAKLEPADVSKMLAGLTARGLSPTTAGYARTVLRTALARAVKTGRVARNVATLVDPPTKRRSNLTPLSVAEVGTFLESVSSDRLAALYTAAIGLGLRQGELLGLRWSDVDLDAGLLSVRHSLQRLNGTLTLVEPKTAQSRRTVAMPATVARALREHRRRQLEERLAAGRRWRDTDHVFTSRTGTPLDGINVTHTFQRHLAAAGLPHQRFHDLRHACATLLLEAGEDLAVVSKLLGHSSLATTADVYAHLTRSMQRGAAARMDGILDRPATSAVG
jgi:integrase